MDISTRRNGIIQFKIERLTAGFVLIKLNEAGERLKSWALLDEDEVADMIAEELKCEST